LTKLGGGVKNWLQRGFALSKERQELLYFRSVKEFALYADDPIKERNRVGGAESRRVDAPLTSSRIGGRLHSARQLAALRRRQVLQGPELP
jgi:hypothetical protein